MSSTEWIVVGLIASPFVVYGLTRVGAIAWFRSKRNHFREMLNELKDD